MRKKKICVVIPTHWSSIMGGAEYQVSLITENLLSCNQFDITVISRNVNPNYHPKNYHIKTIKKNIYLGRFSKVFDIKEIISALKYSQPDIIYQRAGSAYTGICAWYAKKKNIPMVWHISHDLDVTQGTPKQRSFLKHILNLIEKKILEYGIKRVTHIIAQTSKQADLLKKHYGRAPDQIIRNFHPLPANDQLIAKGERITIVWIANFKTTKQPELFVRLAKDLENIVDADFVMIGNSGNPKQYSQLISEIGTIKSLKYLGDQPQEKVNEILSSAHLLVNTSKIEGFSNTFIQAWMREVPVLTLTVDPDDLIKNNDIGVCAGSYEKLKEIIIDLVRLPERRTDMGIKGKQYAYLNHSMANIDKIHETLTKLLATTVV